MYAINRNLSDSQWTMNQLAQSSIAPLKPSMPEQSNSQSYQGIRGFSNNVIASSLVSLTLDVDMHPQVPAAAPDERQ